MHQRDPYKLYPHDHAVRLLTDLLPRFVRPNHLTILRMVLTPVVLWFFIVENYQVGVPLFLATAFTDAMDGTLARTRKQITSWGTFYDPVADKLLIGLVVLLIVVRHINPLLAFLIVFVELVAIVGGLIHKSRGEVVHANVWGKIKMFLQVLGVTALLIALWLGYDLFIPISIGTFSLAVIFAVLSMFTYGL